MDLNHSMRTPYSRMFFRVLLCALSLMAFVHQGTVVGQTLENPNFENGLDGWRVSQSGSQAVPGTVMAVDGQAEVLEGDSFLVSLQQTFTAPEYAQSLSFDLIPTPGFDQAASFIPDAFEASLLTQGMTSAVPTWQPAATSFFNVQENGAVNLGSATSFDGTTVTIGMGAVPAGSNVTLSFDLIGGDADTAGGVRIDNVVVVLATLPVPDVVGLTQADAESAITGSSLTVGEIATANSDTVPAGNVISQSPAAGTEVLPDSAVTLVVSLGPIDPPGCSDSDDDSDSDNQCGDSDSDSDSDSD